MVSPLVMTSLCVTGLGLAGLFWRWSSLRETTLAGPWAWLVLTLVSLALGEYGLQRYSDRAAGAAWQLCLGTLTLCPAMALLGAKRPQHRPWHFIVGTLWLVLALPGIQQLVLGKSGELDVHTARSWFLLIVWLFGALNSLFSRWWWCVLLGAVGQAIWLAPFLPWPFRRLFSVDLGWGLTSYALAVCAGATWVAGRGIRDPSLDRLWRDFRDAYGLVWAVRVAERINATAQSHGWNVAVSWQGFRTHDGSAPVAELPPEQMRAFEQSLRNLLRRFVSESWMARRARWSR